MKKKNRMQFRKHIFLPTLLLCSAMTAFAQEEREPDPLPEIEEGRYTVTEFDSETLGIGSPTGLCVYQDEVYICDYDLGQLVVLDEDLNPVRTIGSIGMGEAEFSKPTAVTVAQDQLYVLDAGNSRVQILTLEGAYVDEVALTLLGRLTFGDYYSLAVDSEGRICVCTDTTDQSANRVRIFADGDKTVPEGNLYGCVLLYQDTFYAADTMEFFRESTRVIGYTNGRNFLYEVTEEELKQTAELPYAYTPTDLLAIGDEIYATSGSFGRIDRISIDGEVLEGIAEVSSQGLKLRLGAEDTERFYVTDREDGKVFLIRKE